MISGQSQWTVAVDSCSRSGQSQFFVPIEILRLAVCGLRLGACSLWLEARTSQLNLKFIS